MDELCPECAKVIEEYEEWKAGIRNDPMARYGGVVGDILEDGERRFIREAKEKLCENCQGIVLGDIATTQFERKIYRDPYWNL